MWTKNRFLGEFAPTSSRSARAFLSSRGFRTHYTVCSHTYFSLFPEIMLVVFSQTYYNIYFSSFVSGMYRFNADLSIREWYRLLKYSKVFIVLVRRTGYFTWIISMLSWRKWLVFILISFSAIQRWTVVVVGANWIDCNGFNHRLVYILDDEPRKLHTWIYMYT